MVIFYTEEIVMQKQKKLLQKVYDKNASHPEIVSLYANTLFNMGKKEEAIGILKKKYRETRGEKNIPTNN